MKTKTKIETEFPDDPMMEQLHSIRREIAEELRGLSPQEKVVKIRRNVRAYLRKRGYDLKDRGDGTFGLVKKDRD
jgi:hypothetical protein